MNKEEKEKEGMNNKLLQGGATVMSYYQHSLRDALNDIYDFDYPNPGNFNQ